MKSAVLSLNRCWPGQTPHPLSRPPGGLDGKNRLLECSICLSSPAAMMLNPFRSYYRTVFPMIPPSLAAHFVRVLAVAGLAAALAGGLAACGRKGSLEPPPRPEAVQQKPGEKEAAADKSAPTIPAVTQPTPDRAKTRFILDPIL